MPIFKELGRLRGDTAPERADHFVSFSNYFVQLDALIWQGSYTKQLD